MLCMEIKTKNGLCNINKIVIIITTALVTLQVIDAAIRRKAFQTFYFLLRMGNLNSQSKVDIVPHRSIPIKV